MNRSCRFCYNRRGWVVLLRIISFIPVSTPFSSRFISVHPCFNSSRVISLHPRFNSVFMSIPPRFNSVFKYSYYIRKRWNTFIFNCFPRWIEIRNNRKTLLLDLILFPDELFSNSFITAIIGGHCCLIWYCCFELKSWNRFKLMKEDNKHII